MDIKYYDYLGTGLSMLAYIFIVNAIPLGFAIGIFASLSLLVVAIKSELHGLKWLQLFFISANIYAVYNNF